MIKKHEDSGNIEKIMYLSKDDVNLLKGIFEDNAIYEYIDSENENCPYKALYEKIMSNI